MRILTAIKYDIKFQVRHGFYHAYLLLTVIYIAGLRMVPGDYRPAVSSLVVFTDPSVLGFFFIGGMVLLEKGQNTLESLFVTPLKVSEYILSKVVSLTMLSLLTSLAIAFFSRGAVFNVFWFVLGVGLSSVLFTLMGFALAARAKSLNHYFLYSFPLAILFLPLLEYLGMWDAWLFFLLPAKPALILIDGAMRGIALWEGAYASAALFIWIFFTYRWAYGWFYKYTVVGTEGGSR